MSCVVKFGGKIGQLSCFLKQCKCKPIPTFYVIQKQAREWRIAIFGWWSGFLMLHFPTITILNFSEKFWCWFCVCSMERWQVGYVFSDKTGGIHGFKTQDTAAAWFQLLMKEVIFLKMLGKFLNYHHLYCNPSKIVPLPQSLFFFKNVHRDTCAQSFDVNQKIRNDTETCPYIAELFSWPSSLRSRKMILQDLVRSILKGYPGYCDCKKDGNWWNLHEPCVS